jgi:hypothetical protein
LRHRKSYLFALIALAMGVHGQAQSLSAAEKSLAQERFTVVAPFPPGGPVDTLARLLADGLQKRYNQSAVVENLAGAAGNLGIDKVKRAKPDGHTLLVVPAGNLTINPTLMRNFPFQIEKDFAPITMLAKAPNVLVAGPGVAVKNLKELAKLAQQAGVELVVEPLNRFETDFLNTCEQGLKLVKAVGARNVNLHLDTFHMNIEEKNQADAIRRAGARLTHFHAWGTDRGTPGNDSLNWGPIVEALHDIGYHGDVVIESFTQDVKVIAAAAAIWRKMEPKRDDIAVKGLANLKRLFSSKTKGKKTLTVETKTTPNTLHMSAKPHKKNAPTTKPAAKTAVKAPAKAAVKAPAKAAAKAPAKAAPKKAAAKSKK